MQMKQVILFFSIFFYTAVCSAQQYHWEAGLAGGISPYLGDINQQLVFSPTEMGAGYGLVAKRHLTPSIAVRLGYSRLSLLGDDKNFTSTPWRMERGFNFKNTLNEFSLVMEYDILGKKRFDAYQTNKKFSPYFSLGAAFATYKPTVDFNEPNKVATIASITTDRNAIKQMSSWAVPVGIGMKYALSSTLNLGIEFSTRVGFSDYLDGVSASGNPDKNDWYGFSFLSLTKQFGAKERVENKEDKKGME
jgi:hypothetical protein